MTEQIEFTDRYDALGIRPPSMLTVCSGDCEGTGVYPEQFQDTGDFDADWRFVTCQDCGGTGRQRDVFTVARRLPRIVWDKAKFARRFVLSNKAGFGRRLGLRILLRSW